MKIKSKLITAALGAAAITGLASCNKSEETGSEQVLRFSAIPHKDSTNQNDLYKPVTDYLAKELGIKVVFVPSSDYSASVSKFKGGDIQLAWFGGATAVQATNAVPGAEAIVAGEKDLRFKSYFIANSATGLTKSESFPTAIKDLKFTYGSSSSTSGCIMPTYSIMQESGKGPYEFFTQDFGFSGAHDKTAEQVSAGTYQVGAIDFAVYDSGVKSGKIDPEKCRVIWETPEFANYNFTVHPIVKEKFGDDFVEKLQKVLVDCKDPAVLKALGRSNLIKVDNSTFSGIAEVMEKVTFKK